MKFSFASVGFAAFAVIVFGLIAVKASAGEPIPGVDIKLGKNPGGAIVARTTTDHAGGFVFDHLGKGSYILSVVVPQKKAPVITSRSNKKHSHGILGKRPDGTTATIEMGDDSLAPMEIVVTTDGGKISGTVAAAAEAKDYSNQKR